MKIAGLPVEGTEEERFVYVVSCATADDLDAERDDPSWTDSLVDYAGARFLSIHADPIRAMESGMECIDRIVDENNQVDREITEKNGDAWTKPIFAWTKGGHTPANPEFGTREWEHWLLQQEDGVYAVVIVEKVEVQ